MVSNMSKYTDLITSAHNQKEKFVKTVDISTSPYESIQNILNNLINKYDIDLAVGDQLDTVGIWVGIGRYLPLPLEGVYFTWDTTIDEGWDAGRWKDTYDPDNGLVKLDDESYRYLIKMQIAANHWHGTKDEAYDIWTETFGDGKYIIIQDFQDMSIEIGFSGEIPTVIKQIIKSGIQPFKPESIRVNTYFTSGFNGPIMGWDIDNDAINGWDTAYWADEIIPQENFY